MSARWRPKTGVIIHTYDWREPNWAHVMWGNPVEPGRIPTAVAAALESDAALLLVFSDFVGERNEGAIIRDFLFDNIRALPLFAPSLPVFRDLSPEEILVKLESIFLLSDVVIKNTEDEVKAVPSLFGVEQIQKVVFVSSFDHISRVAQLAGRVWGEQAVFFPMAEFRPANTLYSGPMDKVVVFEPPAVEALGPVHPKRLLGLRGNSEALARIDNALTGEGV